jgi:hypothetical protein
MKKTLIALFLSLALLPHSGLALETKPVTLFEHAENLQKLESYSQDQALSGAVHIKDGSDNFKIDYRLSAKNEVINKENFPDQVRSEISIGLKVKNTSESKTKDFESIQANIGIDLIVKMDEGFYVRLKNLTVKAEGISKTDQDQLSESLAQANALKNQWFFLQTSALKEQTHTDIDALETEFKTVLKEKGFMEAVRQTMISGMESEGATPEEITAFNQAFSEFTATPIFSVKNGTFKLDKKAVLELIKKLAAANNEEISGAELAQIRSILNKFSLTGRIRENTQYRIWDQAEIRFNLNNIEALAKLSARLTSRIRGINQGKTIESPKEFTPFEELGSMF